MMYLVYIEGVSGWILRELRTRTRSRGGGKDGKGGKHGNGIIHDTIFARWSIKKTTTRQGKAEIFLGL